MMIIDGNTAAAYISYPFTEVAGIYPITPSSVMAEVTDEWSAAGKKNLFGQTVRLVEMQSEAGACGAVHGALEVGALATSYTSSQGLMLMIPTMHRIAGQRHPGVLHVASRTVGTHGFSIFGDHSDVMNCRSTGWAMMCTSSVQEIMDIGAVAHLAAIKGSVPFLHWFDGFRTSHEMQKVEALDQRVFEELLDKQAVDYFRSRALNPEEPIMRSPIHNPDTYFQARESINSDYDALPEIVEDYFERISEITGREYHLFNYYGAHDAERLIIAMGSVTGPILETVEYLNSVGEKVGYVQVHLFRPFSAEHLMAAIPESCKRIAVIDRIKEAGSLGEPLYEDVCTAFINETKKPEIFAGRYGLSSKDTDPTCIKAIFDNLKLSTPKDHFTVGIEDDVTHLSLPLGETLETEPEGTISCKFWGLGSDGTVGANKNSIKIIGEQTDMYCQAYFEYDTKKSFGITKSHLRFGKTPISSAYYVKRANFIGCHNQRYIQQYDIAGELKEGGTLLLNCEWAPDQLDEKLPAEAKRMLAEKRAQLYIINANEIARNIGLGNRPNIVLQAAFFKLSQVIPLKDAIEHMKEAVKNTYASKGEKVVNMNLAAVDAGIDASVRVDIPEEWKCAVSDIEKNDDDLPEFIRKIQIPVNAQKGDELPVSAFSDRQDGRIQLGTSAYEKRGLATHVPVWNSEECLQCNQCSYVCPHAVIRPFLLDEKEAANAPAGFEMTDARGKGMEKLKYAVGISNLDCTSCGSCVNVCPKGGKALKMVAANEVPDNREKWDYVMSLKNKGDIMDPYTVKGSQFRQPLLEFSGACAGCGETPYVKLLTQLYGDRMYMAGATGCIQAWLAALPCFAFCKNKDGRGPAESNSLFENNAEFSYGMCLAVEQQRNNVKMKVEKLYQSLGCTSQIKSAIEDWLYTYDDLGTSVESSERLVEAIKDSELEGEAKMIAEQVISQKNHLSKKTMWMVGGDGWAYDIGYAGLDHVFAMNADVNVLVVDTEVYSNTGGQSSKATPIGAVAQFQASGKVSRKKDLGMQLMSYDNVYVAQCAMGADQSQFVKAMKEAVEHKGPSIIICYAPCINHGIRRGMTDSQAEMKAAVASGYWNLYRYTPEDKVFHLDSKAPTEDLRSFLRGEVRYSSLELSFPENAEKLFAEAERAAKEKYEYYRELAERK